MKSTIVAAALGILSILPAGAQQISTYFAPYDDCTSEIVNLLNRAQKSVFIAMYGYTSPPVTDELIKLKQQGVDIHLCLDRTQAAGKSEQLQLARLRDAGIDFVTGTSCHDAISHDKYCIIDGEWVEDGSFNWSPSAQKQNNVVNIVHSPARAAKFYSNWQAIHDWMVAHERAAKE